MAQAHYAIDGAFLHRLGPELITTFEQASIAWHRLLALELESIGGGKGKGKGKSISSQHGPYRREASQQLTSRPAKRGRIGGSESLDPDPNID